MFVRGWRVWRSRRAALWPSNGTARSSRPRPVVVILVASLAAFIPFTTRAETASARVEDLASPWSAFIVEAAERFAIPAAWIRAVMRAESGGDVTAVSPRGAVGLMQIMPNTYTELCLRYGLGHDPSDPHDNIVAGAAYLREMYDRFGVPGFIAAYNVGPARYQDHLANGYPLPKETRDYVASVVPRLAGTLSVDKSTTTGGQPDWQTASLFVARSERKSADALLLFSPQPPHINTDRNVTDLSGLTPAQDGLFISRTQQQRKP